MQIKTSVTKAYNKGADLWHKTRSTTLKNYSSLEDLKQNRPYLFIEKPAMYAKIPDLKGKSVLCLGCGSGEECEFLLSKNPARVTGIDISKKLIEIAKKKVPAAEFFVMDAEKLKFKNQSFDFVYCSLMLDYFKDWNKVLGEVFRVLKTKGIFLFSNIHPVTWAAETIIDKDGKRTSAIMGFDKDSKRGKQRIHGDYLNTRLHKKTWTGNISVYFYTKSISQMFNEIIKSGLKVTEIMEPKAIPKTKKYDQQYWERNQRIPNFIIFETRKS